MIKPSPGWLLGTRSVIKNTRILQPLFFDILKKTQGPKNSKLKENSIAQGKKLKVWASFKEIVLLKSNFSNKHPSLGCFYQKNLIIFPDFRGILGKKCKVYIKLTIIQGKNSKLKGEKLKSHAKNSRFWPKTPFAENRLKKGWSKVDWKIRWKYHSCR